MRFKGMAAMLLALVFQLAQVPLAVAVQTGCHDLSAHHCDCCTDVPSCPCARDGERAPERSSMPVLPQTTKLPTAKLCETRILPEDTPVPKTGGRIHVSPVAASVTGYAGVSLAVAFCSYLM